MEPIRVLQVVGRMTRGGIETFIMNVYRNIDRTKVQFDFLCHYGEEAEYNDEIRNLGGRIYEMPKIKSTNKTYYYKIFQYRKELNKFFNEHNEFKVVHGHMTNTASIYMPIAKKHGVKYCIVHSHLSHARKGLSGITTNILQLPLERIADDYFACSDNAAKWIYSEKTIKSNRVKIIKNAIDSNAYVFNSDVRIQYRRKLHLENQFVIGHVGRFYHEKNHNFIIDIFSEIVKLHQDSILILVGKGDLKEEIENKVKNLGLSNKVLFLGMRSDVSNLMQAMDVFVMPSYFEGLPLVGIEAQASGLKCIMADTITKEINITDNVEFLPLTESAERWAKEILKYNSYTRDNTKEKIEQAGYDIKAIADWLQEFYLKKYNN